MNNIKIFLRKVWNDPVWSNVIALAIFGFISTFIVYINSLLSQISFIESANKIKSLLVLKIYLPLWLLLIICIGLIYSGFRLYNLFKRRLNKISGNETKNKFPHNIITSLNNTKRITVDNEKILQIPTDFLELEKGIFSIWVNITDYHNRIQLQRKNLYIVGYATNNGVSLRNPKLANYPNAWAILRITATEADNLGIWRFWCNNIRTELTHLDYKEPLSGGWHLFSVAWSKENNYIKFIIDRDIVAEGQFANWPTDSSGIMMVGTWSNKAIVHNFDSKLGPIFITKSEYNENLIKGILKNRQSEFTSIK